MNDPARIDVEKFLTYTVPDHKGVFFVNKKVNIKHRLPSKPGQIDEKTGLFIWNYTSHTEYKKKWDDVTRMCRGLVTTPDGVIVARPFPKFFNSHERDAYKPDGTEEVTVYEKLDGSLGILFWYKDDWRVVTRGSFTSEQSVKARQMLDAHQLSSLEKSFTYMMEIIYPENRIVVDYGPRCDVTMLAVFETASGREVELEGNCADINLVNRYNEYSALSHAELKLSGKNNMEGFVVRYKKGEETHRVKVKLDLYMIAHRNKDTRIDPKKVLEVYVTAKSNATIDSLRARDDFASSFADEFFDVISDWWDRYEVIYNNSVVKFEEDCTELKTIIEGTDEKNRRKVLAVEVQRKNKSWQKAYFWRFDGKSDSVQRVLLESMQPHDK
ncbi:RNA ligase [Planoprotostelium fungivorum]|uniref:RNA ligase n=1 Tax=Planoprotostelium fungivorum TaxID=1890364 RepID=A0A2P6NTS1_9EUKA|nr:RNA ligase [Planoprotostelium fungivorum]